MHVEVKELGTAIQAALKSVNYHGKDIEIHATNRASTMVAGGDGMRGFTIVVNLDTGKFEGLRGSWGGSNMFTHNAVDNEEVIDIPSNGAVIKGTTGYPRTFAWIYAPPEAMGRMLPSGEPAEELTDEENRALYCFVCIKGGEYRREEIRRKGVQAQTILSLIERGYLKRNKSGATQVTTKGKNAFKR
jgi:hypothetical protein